MRFSAPNTSSKGNERDKEVDRSFSEIESGRCPEEVTDSQGEDRPADETVDSGIQVDIELLHDRGDTDANTTKDPSCQEREEANSSECNDLLPFGPVEGIVDVVRRLRNKDDFVSQLLFLEVVGN